jgi:hypothetical protein
MNTYINKINSFLGEKSRVRKIKQEIEKLERARGYVYGNCLEIMQNSGVRKDCPVTFEYLEKRMNEFDKDIADLKSKL